MSESIFQLLERFQNETDCIKYLESIRWPDGNIISPHDPTSKVYRTTKLGKYKCRETNKYFTVRTGTIFADSNIRLKVWFVALYIVTHHKKGISSHQLAKDLGVSQKTGWFLLHRLRHAMGNRDYDAMLTGLIEADETYLGGKDKNKHKTARANAYEKADFDLEKRNSRRKTADLNTGRALSGGKAVVFGMIERKGKVRAKHIVTASRREIEPELLLNVEKQARLYTDDYSGYGRLKTLGFNHEVIKHSEKIYVSGDIHTNTIENFWSVLKRGVFGTYHVVTNKHLQAYINEFSFRFNKRAVTQQERFSLTLLHTGKLSYKNLIGNVKDKKRYIRKEYREAGQGTEGNGGKV